MAWRAKTWACASSIASQKKLDGSMVLFDPVIEVFDDHSLVRSPRRRPYRKLNPNVVMMKPAESGERSDGPVPVNDAGNGRVLAQRPMSANFVSTALTTAESDPDAPRQGRLGDQRIRDGFDTLNRFTYQAP